ncbi:macrophage colony-stimulating factor 1 receptor [Tiliqua scincoides]|uniref:macrophage colony-stimulating factor 1 receptor n=1 Tax=Tiliqua scincoides TaxID=71010 RepID=UPI0034622157
METITPRAMNPALLWMILVAVADVWRGSASPTISPNISTVMVNFGDRVTFVCSGNSSVEWVGVKNKSRLTVYPNGTLFISKARCEHMRNYQCAYINNTVESASIYLSVRDKSSPWCVSSTNIGGTEGRDVLLPCLLTDPGVSDNITLLKDKNDTISSGFSFTARDGIRLHRVNKNHTGSYQCQALIQGQWLKSPEISLHVEEVYPVSVVVGRKEYVKIKGEPFNVNCRVSCQDSKYSGYWSNPITNLTDVPERDVPDPYYTYATEYILFIPAVQFKDSGKYICYGISAGASNSSAVVLHVTEKGFVRLSTRQKMSQEIKLHGSLDLLVLIEAYPSLLQWKWTHTNPSASSRNFTYTDQMSSVYHRYNNTLVLNWLEEKHSGMYTFFAENNVSNASITFNITVKIPPKISVSQNSSSLSCQATGYPAPHIQWYKLPRLHRSDRCGQGGILHMNDTSPQIIAEVPFGKISLESTVEVGAMESNVTWCCLAVNSEGNESHIFTSVILREVISNATTYDVSKPVIAACVGTMALLLLFIIFLLYKYKQKPKYQVRWKIIEACEGNNYIFIDPTQLPYNEKWEFPRNNLQFGKILGAGAFGKVVEATAFGLGKDDSVLKVAVKMLKSTAHADEKEALISELKIMSHLGHHENIVNLLGACTHGGPVFVITEYCPYGDLLNFLREKAESLTIQDVTVESLPESLATDYKNIYLAKKYVRSDSGFGSHSVDHYLEMKPVTASVSMPAKERSSESTTETEDSHSLSMHDLLQFSNQVAEGMSFLASKNCIHRDLAARNVLLADGRVAKICDFGLARDIMNDANYVVKGNARLPVKWMAPESIFECVYTVQSDVWSYGILLWEIFSLGRSPYPGMKVNGDFYRMVKQGYHMGRPDFAPDYMYNIMKACWNLEPTQRPTFNQICIFIQKQLAANKEQDYRNLPREEGDSGCEEASYCEESCESVESKQPLLNSNNYQFC